MKRITVIMIIFLFIGGTLLAESFRMGGTGSVELVDKSYDEIVTQFGDQNNIFTGFYWEVLIDHVGFGMTYLVRFDRMEYPEPFTGDYWTVDYIGSWDFRYHFFERFFIDPFLEAGFGAAGENRLTGPYNYDHEAMKLSLFGQVGGGCTVRLDDIHVGTRLLYRVYNDVPPVTDFAPYPLKNFQFSIFAGFSF